MPRPWQQQSCWPKGVGSLFLRGPSWYSSVKQGDSCGDWQKKTPDPLRVCVGRMGILARRSPVGQECPTYDPRRDEGN